MKNVLLSFAIALFVLNGAASAQNIVTQSGSDTAKSQYTGGSTGDVYNRVKSGTTDSFQLRWSVSSSYFDNTNWMQIGSGICDNNFCQTATASNNIFTNGSLTTSNYYNNSGFSGQDHDFHVQFLPNNPANGSYAWVRVNARELTNNTSRTLTFIAYKGTLGISNISSSDDVVLFPNPARDAVNVLYDDAAGVKTIAVYNLIGKLMGPIYKPSSNNGAKIDLGDMPTGIYFLRLMDSQGHVVATRRFTRQ